MAKELNPKFESALARLRKEDEARRMGRGTPLTRLAKTAIKKEETEKPSSLEAKLRATYMLPSSVAAGFFDGIIKGVGNILSFVRVLDQKEVDAYNKKLTNELITMARKMAPKGDEGGRELLGNVGNIGGAIGEMGSYVAPYLGFARILQVVGVTRPLTTAIAADFLIGTTAVSPNEENIFNLIEKLSKEENIKALEVIGSIVATNPENSEFENRINNGVAMLVELGLSEAAIRSAVGLFRKMASSTAKAQDATKQVDEAVGKLPKGIKENVEKIIEPDPKDPNALGTKVDEIELDQQMDEVLVEPTETPIKKKKSKPIKPYVPITPEEFLEKYKEIPDDSFPFKGVPSASDKDEFLDALKKAKTQDDYDDLFNVLEEEESYSLKGSLLADTESVDKNFASNYLSYLENKDIDKYMVEAGNMADALKANKVTVKNHPVVDEQLFEIDDELSQLAKEMKEKSEFEKETEANKYKFITGEDPPPDLFDPDPKFKEEFDKKAKEKEATLGIGQFEEFEKIGPKPGGSADGAKVRDKATGIEYIAKFYKDPEQAAQEVITAKAYQITGTKTPDVKVVNAKIDGEGKVFLLSEFIDDIEPYNVDFVDPEDMGRIHVAAALMKDWDAVGLAKDNIAFGKKLGPDDAQGKPKKAQLIQLDAGGSGAFRAMGGYKPNSKDFFDVPSNSTEDWSSLVSEKNEAARSVFMDAYNKDPIAYMQGVKKALAQFRMNQEEMYETVESATKVVGMNGDDAVDNFINTYGSRWNNLSKSLQDSVDAHDAIVAKPIPINEKELQKITFSPSDKTSDESIQKALTTYRSTPEYKAQKQGFDPTGGFQRFSQGELMFQQPYPSLIQGTTLTPAAYYKAKAAGDTGEDILGKELNEAIQQQEIPSSEEIVKQKKALGVGKKQTDEELSAPTNLPLGVMPLPSYTRKQASFVDKVLKEKGVKEKVKFMLDPFGSRNWTFKQLKKGVNTKKVDGKSKNIPVGPIYGGNVNQNAFVFDKPIYNNAYIFEDGISSSNYIIQGKKKLYQGTKAGAQTEPPMGAIPLQFLTLGKSLDMHVPPAVEGYVLPQNPNVKELTETYRNVVASVENYPKGGKQDIDVILGYVDLIFSNAYGSTALKAAKGLGEQSAEIKNLTKTTRFKKFTYAPNTPQGRAEYQKEFGDTWVKEASFRFRTIEGWKPTEASGGYITRFLVRINEQANEVGDVFLTIPVNDEMKNKFLELGTSKLQQGLEHIVRIPYSQATLPPRLAKEVVKGSNKKIKDIFKVGKSNEYITTIKAITLDPKDPTKISKELSAKFSTLNDTNVLASYMGPVAAIASINQFIPKDTKETIEIEVEDDEEFVPLDQGESIKEELPQTELDTTPITREATEKSTSSTLEDGTVVLHPTIYKDKETNIPQELSGEDALIAAMDFEARNPNLEFPRFDTVEEADQYSRERSEAGGASEMPLYLDTTEEELDIDSQMSDLNLGEQSDDELRQRA